VERLNNKTCIITGAARGIGRAIATRGHVAQLRYRGTSHIADPVI